MHHSRYLFCALAISSSTVTLAESTDEDLFFEIPVVLSATRLEQPASETPVAVSVIDRQVIEASGARNIPDILRLVPGMVVARAANEFGDEPKMVVAYHGHSDQYSRRMQVLIDGRSIYEPVLGGVNWNMVPINVNDIERIEISRGPNAASYGANSFLAVVNIITRHATEDQGLFLQSNAGNHGIHDVTYRYGGGNDDDIDYRITMTTQKDDGQDRADGIENHDGVNANVLDYRIDFQLDSHNAITYQGGYGLTTQEIDQNFATLGIKPVRDSDNTTAYQFFKWENIYDSDNTFIWQYYLNYFDRDDVATSDVFDPALLGLNADPFTLNLNFSLTARRHNLEFTHYNNALQDTRIIWGLSAQLDDVESPYFIGAGINVKRKTWRAFTNIEHKLDRANIIHFGVLLESNDFKGDSSSPRLSYIFKPYKKHAIRLSISKAIRQPFVLESNANTFFTKQLTTNGGPLDPAVFALLGNTDVLFYQQLIANDTLMTESIISRDIGYYGTLLDDDLQLDIRLFDDKLNDLIDTENITYPQDNLAGVNTDTFTNQYASRVRGVEIEFDYFISEHFRLLGSGAYINIDSSSLIIRESAPKRSGSLMGIWTPGNNYSLTAALYYVGDMSFTDVNNSVNDPSYINTRGYRKLDIRIARTIPIQDYNATIGLVMQNLLDKFNDFDADPANGPLLVNNKTWYLELRINHK